MAERPRPTGLTGESDIFVNFSRRAPACRRKVAAISNSPVSLRKNGLIQSCLKSLKLHCRHVYVDVLKGEAPALRATSFNAAKAAQDHNPRRRKPANLKRITFYEEHKKSYPKARPASREIFRADALYQQVYRSLAQVLRDVNTHGVINAKEAVKATGAMVESILRSPDAFIWLTKVRAADEHTYTHAIRAAVWAIIFGRHIGLNRVDLNALAVGVLLKDVGKTKLPQEILTSTDRTPDEQACYQSFVEKSTALLKDSQSITKKSLEVIRTHCERLHGTGFPKGLSGDRIPLLGKIAGIVTSFDELTHPRNASSVAPSKAIAALYDQRDIEFQEDLVVHFIQAIGLYPPGTVVELSSGELGVVLEQNSVKRLLPKLLLITDSNQQTLWQPRCVDLALPVHKNGRPTVSQPTALTIKRDIAPSSLAIDIDAIKALYFSSLKNESLVSKLRHRLARATVNT